MIIDLREDEDIDDFLEHHGVKGMRWGVRRKSNDPSATSDKRLQKIDTKLNKLNPNRVAAGAGLVGHYQNKRIRASNHPYAKTKSRIALRGAVEAAIIYGAGTFAVKRLFNPSPSQLRGAKIALGLLATGVGAQSVSEIRSVTAAKRHAQLLANQKSVQVSQLNSRR